MFAGTYGLEVCAGCGAGQRPCDVGYTAPRRLMRARVCTNQRGGGEADVNSRLNRLEFALYLGTASTASTRHEPLMFT